MNSLLFDSVCGKYMELQYAKTYCFRIVDLYQRKRWKGFEESLEMHMTQSCVLLDGNNDPKYSFTSLLVMLVVGKS